MVRVLDLDLDFFVQPAASWVSDSGPRLEEDRYTCATLDAASEFLVERCHLQERIPGWVVEHHDEAFYRWRDAVNSGLLDSPFHVTHIDAHADLGFGESGWVHLLTEVMHGAVEERCTQPQVPKLNYANWLAFAVACGWISDLDYVFCLGGGSDVLHHFRSDSSEGLQLRAVTMDHLKEVLFSGGGRRLEGQPDPLVPFRELASDDFVAEAPYDFFVLCRSPGYTPESADVLFEYIRHSFIDEL